MHPTKIIRSKRRSIALVITSDATLTVHAPMRASLEYIDKVIFEKMSWIIRKIAQMQARPKVQPKNFVEGELLLFLGAEYPMRIDGGNVIGIENGELLFPRTLLPRAKESMVKWYKREARKIITQRADHFSKLMGVEFTSIKLSSARGRWGSCSHKNSLNFNWRLIMTSIEVLDYVVVHELAHIHHKNHSQSFWCEVQSFSPAFKQHKSWLKVNGATLFI